jgi:hypothetical protein
MIHAMTKHFAKWADKHKIPEDEIALALKEVQAGNFEVNLGGHIYKKRIRFSGQGKSSSGRTIVCYKKGDRAILIHGFAKNEKPNISKKELQAFREFAKILLGFSRKEIELAIKNGVLIEVTL